MESDKNQSKLKEKFIKAGKIFTGAVTVSVATIGGAAIIGDDISLFNDTPTSDDFGSDNQDSSDIIQEGSSAIDSDEEIVEVLSNDTDDELYHRYGC